jgi:uncharacterized membrane protein YkoI
MARLRCFIVAGLWLALTASSGSAAEASTLRCLSKDQQRSAVGSGKAVALAKAIRASKRRSPGEVVRARLCQEDGGSLVYVLTVLSRNGKVTRTVIDAADGAVAGDR